MPPLPVRRRTRLRGLRWLFLLLGLALLGYVAGSYFDAGLFQVYASWRLDQTVESTVRAQASAPPLVRAPAAATAPSSPARVAVGAVLGRIEIGRIGVRAMVAEGFDQRTLRRAVGHIPGTALPGATGNVVLTGHRDTFFRALRNIRQDDEIVLTTTDGSYRYRVRSTRMVAPSATEVLDDSDEAVLTLVTCYPFYFVGPAPERFVVRADLDR